MTSRQVLVITLVHFGVALSVIIAASVLAAMHDIDAQAVTALFGTAVGLVGGTGASLASGMVANGRSTASPGA